MADRTNREIASARLEDSRLLHAYRSGEDYTTEDCEADEISIESALNDAKRDGVIEALEWVLIGRSGLEFWARKRVEVELARLKAELAKERR